MCAEHFWWDNFINYPPPPPQYNYKRSTMSSAQNGLAANILKDMIEPKYLEKKGVEMSDRLSFYTAKGLGKDKKTKTLTLCGVRCWKQLLSMFEIIIHHKFSSVLLFPGIKSPV